MKVARVGGGPAAGAEFGVQDFLMSPGAFTRGVFWTSGGEGFSEVCGEILVAFQLGGGVVI